MSVRTTAFVVGLALLLFLIAAAVLFRQPISDLAKARAKEIDRGIADAHEQARLRAIENALTLQLNDANCVWEQLRTANATLAARVEVLLGQPLESAIASPPASLRKSLIVSDATLHVWTDLINSRLTPQDVTQSNQLLTNVTSHVAQHMGSELDGQQLKRFIDWAALRRHTIDAIDLDCLGPNQALDDRTLTATIDAPERRSVE